MILKDSDDSRKAGKLPKLATPVSIKVFELVPAKFEVGMFRSAITSKVQ